MGGGGAQRPVLHVNESKKDGCAQRPGAHARPKPTSPYIFPVKHASYVVDFSECYKKNRNKKWRCTRSPGTSRSDLQIFICQQ
jgi:hypothetical protein